MTYQPEIFSQKDDMGLPLTPNDYNAAGANLADIPQWYVAYTYPRHEKAVADQVQLRAIETFLPTYAVKSQWKDRRVQLELPLFAGYVFTRMTARERVKVLSVPSVIRILSYRGMPVPVSDAEIEIIRMCLRAGGKLEPHPYITVGDRVRVREGAFEGLEGIVVRKNNRCKLVVSIELIHQSVSLEVDPQQLELAATSDLRVNERGPAGTARLTALGW
jgi:transcription antitermination factor NusG